MEIIEIFDQNQKSSICNRILRGLPEWFGNEEPIVDYTAKVRDMPFYIALQEGEPIGFLAVKIQNPDTAEVCVMGVLKEYHRMGVGARLMSCAEQYCRRNGHQYLTVKTLDSSAVFEPYERTRKFYKNMGFVPLEVFPLYWDAENPCLFLAKHLSCEETR